MKTATWLVPCLLVAVSGSAPAAAQDGPGLELDADIEGALIDLEGGCLGEGGGTESDTTEEEIYYREKKTCVINTDHGGRTCLLTKEEHTYRAHRDLDAEDKSWQRDENSFSSSAAFCV